MKTIRDQLSNTEAPDYYDESWLILKTLPELFREAGIPDHEPMSAIADFLILSTLAIAESQGLSEFAAQVIIERQQNLLQDYLEGNPPFFDGDFNGKPDPEQSLASH